MIYELRVYDAAPGSAAALRRRFREQLAPLYFPRHGIELVGLFSTDGDEGRLTYVTRFDSEAARTSAWESFSADPEWQAARAASEAAGPLIASRSLTLLTPLEASLLLG